MFEDYPDVVNVSQLREMLGGISRTSVYKILKSGSVQYRKIANKYLITKSSVIDYILQEIE